MTNDIRSVWSHLAQVQILSFRSESRTGIGWSGSGSGRVKVLCPSPDVLVFEESGRWQQSGGKELQFSNVFRWTLLADHIRLEHLRFGHDNPVFLFEMAPDEEGNWRDINPHPCRDDCYSATLRTEAEQLLVTWSVNGPKRDETIDYTYI